MENLKLVKVANVRRHMDAHFRGKISYTEAVNRINEDANKALNTSAVVNPLPTDECVKQIVEAVKNSIDEGFSYEEIVDTVEQFLEIVETERQRGILQSGDA